MSRKAKRKEDDYASDDNLEGKAPPRKSSKKDSDDESNNVLICEGQIKTGASCRSERLAKYNQVSLPLLILHGKADSVTDPSVSKELYEKAKSSDKKLELYKDMHIMPFSCWIKPDRLHNVVRKGRIVFIKGATNFIRNFFELNTTDWFDRNLRCREKSDELVACKCVFALGCCHLWSWRNKAFFRSDFVYPTGLQSEVLNNTREIISASARASYTKLWREELLKWTQPQAGWCKLNVDGCSKGNPGVAGAGGLIREGEGQLVGRYVSQYDASKTMTIHHKLEIEVIETIFMLEGLKFAVAKGLTKLVAKNHPKNVITILNV